MIIPLADVHRGTLEALRYARSLSDDMTAEYMSIDPAEAEAVRQNWEVWGGGLRLVILESPYRLLLEPLLQYIADIAARRQPNETITIVVPQFISGRWWHNFLHNQTAIMLRLALLFRRGIVITDVPSMVNDAGIHSGRCVTACGPEVLASAVLSRQAPQVRARVRSAAAATKHTLKEASIYGPATVYSHYAVAAAGVSRRERRRDSTGSPSGDP